MLVHYLVLGLPHSASDADIRHRYLELVRRHAPERDPERFQKVTEAYEALRDRRRRIQSMLFGVTEYPDHEMALDALVDAHRTPRRTPGLKTLLAAEGKPGWRRAERHDRG